MAARGDDVRVDPSWPELLERLRFASSRRPVLLVGPTDTGKSTLCRWLAARLSAEHRVALIDGDPGQSSVGPPACVALQLDPAAQSPPPPVLRFVGATRPTGHLLQTLAGLRRLQDRAVERGAERVLVDFPGYGVGSGALRELHYLAIDLSRAEHLVALQRERELEPLLADFARRVGLAIHRPKVAEATRRRSPAARRENRRRRFARYFERARPTELDVSVLGLHGRVPPPGRWEGRLISLGDVHGFTAALALAQGPPVDGRLPILAPPFDPARIATVELGALHLDPAGRER
jgi:polynucleotide 5'-hydroxyl-kinase GRC3/NOL9